MRRIGLGMVLGVALAIAAPVAQDHGARTIIIRPLAVPSGSEYLAAVARVVTETISLSLRLAGRYEVVGMDAVAGAAEPLEAMAGGSVVGGACFQTESGAIRFELDVTDGTTGERVHETAYEAESLFDVFDVADAATISLLEAITSSLVEFAQLRVVAEMTGAPFSVRLDGQHLADVQGSYANDRIPAGTYQLRISQERPLGEAVLYEEPVTIAAARPTTVRVAVPLMTAAERERVAGLVPARVTERDVDFRELWRRGAGVGLVPEVQQFVDTGTFPAGEALVEYIRQSGEAQARLADAWMGGTPGSRIIVPVRTIVVDGDAGDWEGVPHLELRREPGAAGGEPETVPTAMQLATDVSGRYLFVRYSGSSAAVRRSLHYRLWIIREGSELVGRENFQVDLRTGESMRTAYCQWWATAADESRVEFALPATIVRTSGAVEAVIDLEERILPEEFRIGAAIIAVTGESWNELMSTDRTPVRILRSAAEPGHRGASAVRLTGVAVASASPRGAALSGQLATFVSEQITERALAWRPSIVWQVADDDERLRFAIDGPVGAERVRVIDRSGLFARSVALGEAGASPMREGYVEYRSAPTPPGSIRTGYGYVFEVTRDGHTFEMPAFVPAYTRVREPAIEVAYDVDVRAHQVAWTRGTIDLQYRVVIAAEEAGALPDPSEWRWVAEVDAGVDRVSVVPAALGRFGPLRAHVVAIDPQGNESWSGTTLFHAPRNNNPYRVTPRSITIDGSPEDWAGIVSVPSADSDSDWRGENVASITGAYLAADDEYLYLAYSHDSPNPTSYEPQFQIYTSFTPTGQHDGALLIQVEGGGRTVNVGFDEWSLGQQTARWGASDGVRIARSDAFVEMRIPRAAIGLETFEINLVARRSESSTFHHSPNFHATLP